MFVELARFWRIGDGPIAMMTLHCDESDDGQTYALGGWLAVPSAWDDFDPAWKAMIKTIVMPDGSPCKAFHAAEIVGKDQIRGSKFKGWDFADEVAAFTKATDLMTDKQVAPLLWPVGVSVEIPADFRWIQRDAIWLMLFTKMFQLLATHYPVQRSISFLFDEKAEIADNALLLFKKAKERYNEIVGEEYLAGVMGFGSDEEVMGLQAADFLVYEWRKRISDSTHRPDKKIRRSWERIRAARNDGALWRYGRSLYDEALLIDPITGDQSSAYMRRVLRGDPTQYD